MKKYFTKYLPVDGEPELGKMCFVNGKLDMYTEWHWREWINYDTFDKAHQPIKAARLFLCSKDIQAGDKPIYMPSGKYHTVTGITQPMLDDNEVEKLGLYKALGKISLEAVWLSEDVVITEDEVKFQTSEYPPFEGDVDCTEEEFTKSEAPFKKIKILCPICKTYH